MGCGSSTSAMAFSAHDGDNNLPKKPAADLDLQPVTNNNAALADENLKTRMLTRNFTLNSADPSKDYSTAMEIDQNFIELKVEDNNELEGLDSPQIVSVNQGYHTEVGFAPFSRKVNQDSLLIATELNEQPGLNLYGVFDGHGEFGHLVSRFVAEKLPVFLEAELLNDSVPPERCLNKAVFKLSEALRSSSIRTTYSGTTATFALLDRSILYVGNCGDSRAVLARKQIQPDGSVKYIAKDLSIDHKPDLPAEKQRILAAGGRVETLRGPPGADCGPYRVWLAKVDVPGLAMSRSIGDDVAHSVGVSTDVEVLSHRVTEDDAFLILATDGVWEFIESQAAVDIVGKYSKDLNKAARKLVKRAQLEWRKNEQVIDDTTCVIVSFLDSDSLGLNGNETDSSVESTGRKS